MCQKLAQTYVWDFLSTVVFLSKRRNRIYIMHTLTCSRTCATRSRWKTNQHHMTTRYIERARHSDQIFRTSKISDINYFLHLLDPPFLFKYNNAEKYLQHCGKPTTDLVETICRTSSSSSWTDSGGLIAWKKIKIIFNFKINYVPSLRGRYHTL